MGICGSTVCKKLEFDTRTESMLLNRNLEKIPRRVWLITPWWMSENLLTAHKHFSQIRSSLSWQTKKVLTIHSFQKAYLLSRGYLSLWGWEFGCRPQVEKSDPVLQKFQEILSQDDSMQVKRLATTICPSHIWGHWKCLVIIALQCLYELPDLHVKINGHMQLHYNLVKLSRWQLAHTNGLNGILCSRFLKLFVFTS